MSTLQTLDRGLSVLDLVSRTPAGLSIAEIANELGVHRAICYRIVATLEQHHLVARDGQGRVRLGAGAVTYSERFLAHLRRAAQPVLQELANATGATAFLSVAEGSESVAIAVAESENTFLRVGYRVGSRHPLDRGAAGTAILARRAPVEGEPAAVRTAREDGIAFSVGEIEQGATGAAVGFTGTTTTDGLEASVGVVTISDLDGSAVTALVQAAAERLAQLL